MASPPFTINTAAPADDSVGNQFPALERTFRDVVDSWLRVNHNDYGQHFLIEVPQTDVTDPVNRPAGKPAITTLWAETNNSLHIRFEDNLSYWTIPIVPFDAVGIPNNSLADVPTATLKGRITAGAGDVEDLTGTQAVTILDVFTAGDAVTAGLKGLVPAPAAGDAIAGKLLSAGGWVAPPAMVTPHGLPDAVLQDQKSEGTSGGSLTSGAWRDRTINTESFDPNAIVSIASNIFTLAAGTYVIQWSSPAFEVGMHQTRLLNYTDGLVYYGTSEYTADACGCSNRSSGITRVTIAASKGFKIQHQCSISNATNGAGHSTNSFGGNVEVYTVVTIWKL